MIIYIAKTSLKCIYFGRSSTKNRTTTKIPISINISSNFISNKEHICSIRYSFCICIIKSKITHRNSRSLCINTLIICFFAKRKIYMLYWNKCSFAVYIFSNRKNLFSTNISSYSSIYFSTTIFPTTLYLCSSFSFFIIFIYFTITICMSENINYII